MAGVGASDLFAYSENMVGDPIGTTDYDFRGSSNERRKILAQRVGGRLGGIPEFWSPCSVCATSSVPCSGFEFGIHLFNKKKGQNKFPIRLVLLEAPRVLTRRGWRKRLARLPRSASFISFWKAVHGFYRRPTDEKGGGASSPRAPRQALGQSDVGCWMPGIHAFKVDNPKVFQYSIFACSRAQREIRKFFSISICYANLSLDTQVRILYELFHREGGFFFPAPFHAPLPFFIISHELWSLRFTAIFCWERASGADQSAPIQLDCTVGFQDFSLRERKISCK